MPWTNNPNGISLTTQTGIADGLLNATAITLTSITATAAGTITAGTVSATGLITSTLTIGSATQIVGAYSYIPVYFGTASALEQLAVYPGYAGSLDLVNHTVSATSALVANYTVQIGSAGAIAVATVANTTSSVGVVQELTTTATTFAATNAIVAIRSAQGTAGSTVLTLVVRRTA